MIITEEGVNKKDRNIIAMKKFVLISAVLCLISGFTGCTVMKSIIKEKPVVGVQPLPPYSGPKARLTVSDFEIRVAKADNKVGAGIKEMLVNTLINSNRFSLVEGQNQDALIKEQKTADPGVVKQGAESERAKAKTPDIIVNAAVAEFEPQFSGGRAGVGGGGSVGSGILGGLSEDVLNKAHLALDIRVIDASTSQILGEKRIQGQASDAVGAIMTSFLHGYSFGTGLAAYANTPMEKAIRLCIIEAVRFIVDRIPAGYYKY